MNNVSNIILIKGIKERSRSIFEILFKTYYSDLLDFAHIFVFCESQAEDIVQDVFANLWDKGGELNINSNIKSYLYLSVKNACLDYLKHINVLHKNKDKLVESLLFTNATTFKDIEQESQELKDRIQSCLQELSYQQRAVICLKVFDGLSYKEIAEELNLSESTVHTHVKRAYRLLRKSLVDLSFIMILIRIYCKTR